MLMAGSQPLVQRNSLDEIHLTPFAASSCRYHAKLGTMHHSLSAQIEAIVAGTDPASAGRFHSHLLVICTRIIETIIHLLCEENSVVKPRLTPRMCVCARAGDDAKRRVDECKSILSGQLTSVSGGLSAVDEHAMQVGICFPQSQRSNLLFGVTAMFPILRDYADSFHT